MFNIHWSILLAVAVIVIALGTGYVIRAHKKKQDLAEQMRRKEAQLERRRVKLLQIESERKVKLAAGALEALDFARDQILKDGVIIDSDIWMGEAYADFFDLLGESGRREALKFTLFGQQFEEMCEMRRAAPHNSLIHQRATAAIQRVEAFQKDELIKIVPAAKVAASSETSPLIIQLLLAATARNRTISFITDDIERRIHVRQLMLDRDHDRIRILDVAKTQAMAATFVQAKKEGQVEYVTSRGLGAAPALKVVPFTDIRNSA